jgi:hypothetical protein
MKWISADIYFETGEIFEVAAPNDAPTNLHEVDCVFAQFADTPKCSPASLLALTSEPAPSLRIVSEQATSFDSPLSYQKRARAPPIVLV